MPFLWLKNKLVSYNILFQLSIVAEFLSHLLLAIIGSSYHFCSLNSSWWSRFGS